VGSDLRKVSTSVEDEPTSSTSGLELELFHVQLQDLVDLPLLPLQDLVQLRHFAAAAGRARFRSGLQGKLGRNRGRRREV